MLSFFAILITLSAITGYVNHRWLKMPATIGVMIISLLIGVILKVVEIFDPEYIGPVSEFLSGFDFSTFVLDFILCFLLFAGALHVNIGELRGTRSTVISYATIGVLLSTFIVGFLTWIVTGWFGLNVSLSVCLLFGALISPTDPIAVIGILSKYEIPSKVKTEIVGESLFNDGVGVVVFTVIYELFFGSGESVTVGRVAEIFFIEVFGGIALGLVIGYIGYLLMKTIDHYQTEIMITLSIVTGGYALASLVHASGPLAMVAAGLLIGNKGKSKAMSDTTADYIDKFWELIDEICNTILFVLIGLQVFLLPYDMGFLLIGTVLIVVTLLGRFLSLLPTFYLFNRRGDRNFLNLRVLTWGGLRGGISIALALSLTGKIAESDLIIACTYCIVLFSIIIQGLTIQRLLKKY